MACGGIFCVEASTCLWLAFPTCILLMERSVADTVGVSLPRVVAGVVLFALVLEGLRLKLGLTVFGQRITKPTRSLHWRGEPLVSVSCCSLYLTKLCGLIASLALGDPLMGELRRKNMADRQVMVYATLLMAIWLVMWLNLEPRCGWPSSSHRVHDLRMSRLTYIDDNATMLLIPLALVLLLEPLLDHGLSGQISALCFNMLKWGFLSLQSVKDMADDNTNSDPPKSPTRWFRTRHHSLGHHHGPIPSLVIIEGRF